MFQRFSLIIKYYKRIARGKCEIDLNYLAKQNACAHLKRVKMCNKNRIILIWDQRNVSGCVKTFNLMSFINV